MDPIDPDTILTNARAKITWGDSAASVRDYLITHGVSAAEADAIIKQLVRERNADIRAIGVQRVFIGASLLLISILLTWYLLASDQSVSHRSTYRISGFLVLMGLFGLWKLIGGLIFLVRPQSDHESIPDIDE